jgi:hypothetical protein
MEMTVLEALQCPSCSTRFLLSAGRVHPGIRRAKCFRCETIFGIEEACARLLAVEPSLTLNDLAGAEEGFAEDTLINIPAPAPAEPSRTFHQEPGAAEGPHYASARDAIERLMGAPATPRPPEAASAMDLDDTFGDLDATLGGTPIRDLEAKARAMAPARPSDMASTVKLTAQEIHTALAAGAPEPVADPATPDPNLLKVQLEQETCNNVTLEQMAAWIEQGRVHEYHMVARQFSDNWIEASKVPALRPVFDRRRRIVNPRNEDLPIPPAEILPPKKSLFGGFFGRN